MNIWDGNQKSRTMSLKNKTNYKFEHSEQNFIDNLQERNSIVQFHLLGGTKLTGKIIGSDDYTILIRNHKYADQLVYKTAITTISLFEEKQNA